MLSGGTLDVDGQSPTINALNGAGVVDNTAAGTATLTIGYIGDNGSFSGVIQNTGGSLSVVKAGNGLEMLTGVNTFTGPTSVSGGTLAGKAAQPAYGHYALQWRLTSRSTRTSPARLPIQSQGPVPSPWPAPTS